MVGMSSQQPTPAETEEAPRATANRSTTPGSAAFKEFIGSG